MLSSVAQLRSSEPTGVGGGSSTTFETWNRGVPEVAGFTCTAISMGTLLVYSTLMFLFKIFQTDSLWQDAAIEERTAF